MLTETNSHFPVPVQHYVLLERVNSARINKRCRQTVPVVNHSITTAKFLNLLTLLRDNPCWPIKIQNGCRQNEKNSVHGWFFCHTLRAIVTQTEQRANRRYRLFNFGTTFIRLWRRRLFCRRCECTLIHVYILTVNGNQFNWNIAIRVGADNVEVVSVGV